LEFNLWADSFLKGDPAQSLAAKLELEKLRNSGRNMSL
jgi:hypothetical protein